MTTTDTTTTDTTTTGEDWLRALRRFLGLSQSAAAAKLGITVVSWGRWECSMTRPKSEHVVKLAEMARQPLEEVAAVFGYTDEEGP